VRFVFCCLLCEEQLGQSHGIDVLAVLVNAHVAGSDFVNQQHIAVLIIAILELDVIQDHALLLQIIGDDLGDLLGHFLHGFELFIGHNAQAYQAFLGDQGIAQLIVLEGHFNVSGQVGALFDVITIAAQEGTNGLVAADNFQALAEGLAGNNFHGGVVQICIYIMGSNAGCIDLFEEIDGHAQVHIANAFNGQANRVLTGIKNAILTGAVVLELEQIIAILQSINILSLAGIDELQILHNLVHSISEFRILNTLIIAYNS